MSKMIPRYDINYMCHLLAVWIIMWFGLAANTLFLPAGLISGCDARPNKGAESRLINDLLSNYSRYGRPVHDVSKPVEITILFYLTQIMSLDERHQVLTTFGWLETHWKDHFLKWNPVDYAGLRQVVLSPKLVWLPDIGVENSAKAIYDDMYYRRFRVSVSNDGNVTWVPGGKLTTSCSLDITYYPFDRQHCHIDLVDWAYTGLQVQLLNGSAAIRLNEYKESGEWEITSTRALSSHEYYKSSLDVAYSKLRFSVQLKRKPLFYTINIMTPCVTMSLLSLLVFYLPPDSGEKVALGITVLLSFSVFLILVSENVPKTSEFVPLLGIYLTLIMTMTATSILICVIVLNLHHRDPTTPIPRWLHHLTFNILSKVVLMTRRTFNKNRSVSRLCKLTRTCTERSHARSARDLLGESFIVDNDDELDPRHYDTQRQAVKEEVRCLLRQGEATWRRIMHNLLSQLEQITEKMRENEQQELLKAEWQIAATVLDRFFLQVFVLLVVIATFVLLHLYPQLHSF